MRKILFRGKDKRDGEWVEGYLAKYKPSASEDKWIVGIVPAYASALYIIEVIPETVGQYTGLTDKNGNKIFEGDILKRKLKNFLSFYHPRMKVVFIPVKACFVAVDIDGSNVTFISDYINNKYELEKIGNVHDNPEMLEEK